MSELEEILNRWNKISKSIIETQEITRQAAKTILEIFINQVKKGEEINLENIDKFCGKEELLDAMQIKLIEISQQQEGKNRRNMLDTAQELTVENMNNPIVWQKLTNMDNVKIASVENMQIEEKQDIEPIAEKIIEDNGQTTTELAVVEPKVNWFKKIKQAIEINKNNSLIEDIEEKLNFYSKIRRAIGISQNKTIYFFGDINQETGEWENVKVEVGEFPRTIKYEQQERLLAIEINGVSKVERKHGLPLYYNLQKVKFGAGVKIIGQELFNENKSIKQVIIGEEVEIIESESFRETLLKKIEIPDNVKVIGKGAFARCFELKEVNIGKGVETIEERGFYDTRFEKINIPDNVKRIGKEAFEYCYELREVTIGQGVEIIGEKAFESSGLEKINIPDNVKKVCFRAFANCDKLKEAVLGKSVENYENNIFNTAIDKVEILDDEPDEIENFDFEYSFKLRERNERLGVKNKGKTVYIFGDVNEKTGKWENVETLIAKFPKEMTVRQKERLLAIDINYIPEVGRSLYGYPNLKKVKFGRGVKRIETYAIEECRRLTDIVIGEDVESIEWRAFRDIPIEKIEIPDNVKDIDNQALKMCEKLKEIIVGPKLLKQAEEVVSRMENCKVKLKDNEKETSNCLELELPIQTIGKATSDVPIEKKVQVEQYETSKMEKLESKEETNNSATIE